MSTVYTSYNILNISQMCLINYKSKKNQSWSDDHNEMNYENEALFSLLSFM